MHNYINQITIFCIDTIMTIKSASCTSLTPSWNSTHEETWCHQMETFSALLALCVGNSPVTGEFPAQRPVKQTLMLSLICAWINGWVNNREAGYLRRHHAHYDVTVMNIEVVWYIDICIFHTLMNVTKTQEVDDDVMTMKTGLSLGNPMVTSGFSSQRENDAEFLQFPLM